MSQKDKATVELEGEILKIHLTADMLERVMEAYEYHNGVRDIVRGKKVIKDEFVSRLLFGGGITFMSDSFGKWLISRMEDIKDSDDARLEDYEEERAKYCDECDELLENCMCDEDEYNG